MILTGERVRLRTLTETDLDLLVAWLDDRERLIGPWQPYEPDLGEQVQSALVDHLEPDPSRGMFGVELCATRQLIGQARYTLQRFVPGYVEFYDIGYGIAELDQRGKGLAREACGLLVGYLFDTYPVERIGAFVYSGNAPSIRLLERLGFKYEGAIRRATFFDDAWHDLAIYGLLRGEWQQE